MQITFDTPEEKKAFAERLNKISGCCELCHAFGVPCMCKVCDVAEACNTACKCLCGDYFVAAITRKGEK